MRHFVEPRRANYNDHSSFFVKLPVQEYAGLCDIDSK